MPTRKKTLHEECESLLKRCSGLGDRRKGHLRVYVGSLTERFQSVDYSLLQVTSLSVRTQSTTASYEFFQDDKQKLAYYLDSFWAFSYSMFDILGHVLNTVHHAVEDESKVSFLRLNTKFLGKETIPANVIAQLKNIRRRWYFKRLYAYRQCCLHRRAVCVRETMTRDSLSIPYTEPTSTEEFKLVTLICDDPNDMRPKFAKNRLLATECETIRNGLEEDITKVLRLL